MLLDDVQVFFLFPSPVYERERGEREKDMPFVRISAVSICLRLWKIKKTLILNWSSFPLAHPPALPPAQMLVQPLSVLLVILRHRSEVRSKVRFLVQLHPFQHQDLFRKEVDVLLLRRFCGVLRLRRFLQSEILSATNALNWYKTHAFLFDSSSCLESARSRSSSGTTESRATCATKAGFLLLR